MLIINKSYLGSGYNGAGRYMFIEEKLPTGNLIHCKWDDGHVDTVVRDTSISAEEQADQWAMKLLL